MNCRPTHPQTPPLLGLATRIGHDVVWLLIAGLFFVVEVAVLVTQFSPRRLLRRWQGQGLA